MNLKKLSPRGQAGPWRDNQGKSAVFASLSRSGLGISETAESSHVTPTPCLLGTTVLFGPLSFQLFLGVVFCTERRGQAAPPPDERRGDAPVTPPILGFRTSPREVPGTPVCRPSLWASGSSCSLAYFYKAAGTTHTRKSVCNPLQKLRDSQEGREGSETVQRSGALPP